MIQQSFKFESEIFYQGDFCDTDTCPFFYEYRHTCILFGWLEEENWKDRHTRYFRCEACRKLEETHKLWTD